MLLGAIGAGYEKKTVLYSFREVVVDFVFRKLELACGHWRLGGASRLKSQPCLAQL